MKTKLFLFIALVATMVACKQEEPTVFKLDPNAMISIKPAAGAFNAPMYVKSTDAHLSALEIVKQATNLSLYNIPVYGNQPVGFGFADMQRDTLSNPPALLMWGTSIISQFGEYVPDFIEASDCVIEHVVSDYPNPKLDTIAYIPNSVVASAKIQIRAALDAKDTTEVYRIFNEAFTFTPITGAEWRALKANNQQ